MRRGTTGRGVGLILDDKYQVVRTIHSLAPGTAADFHELTLSNEGTALVLTYTPKFLEGVWVLDNCFEELTLDEDVFGHPVGASWCATDHISLDENPNREKFVAEGKGNGKTPDRAWDYVHFNSLDKTSDGNYLVSARHLDTIFLISGANGEIIWRLGGPNSSFAIDEADTFARQHDARSLNSTHISLFNNANDGSTLTDNPSAALILALDTTTMTAQKTASYGLIPPTTNAQRNDFIASPGMGNLQLLPSTNHALTSFGRSAAVAEYGPSGGAPLFYADMLAPPALPAAQQQWAVTNYRSTLHPTSAWGAAQPAEPPALWTYARTPTNIMTFYVSWNGATGVDRYRFWVAKERDGGFSFAGSREKMGFETNMTIGSARPWAFAEALDGEGRSMGNSSVVRTYVPAEPERKACGKWHCFPEVGAAVELLPMEGAVGGEEGRIFLRGFDGLGTLALLEHVFALLGLGMCAWLVWRRWRGHGRSLKGYSPVEKEEETTV